MVTWLVVGLLAKRVFETTCETLKFTWEVLEIVPTIESHFAVHAEDSSHASLSLRLSTFPTSRFHCDERSWFPAAFPRSAEGSDQSYVSAKAIPVMKSAAKEPKTAHRIADSRMDLKFAMRLVFYAVEESDVRHSVFVRLGTAGRISEVPIGSRFDIRRIEIVGRNDSVSSVVVNNERSGIQYVRSRYGVVVSWHLRRR